MLSECPDFLCSCWKKRVYFISLWICKTAAIVPSGKNAICMSALLFLWWWVGCFLVVFVLNLIHFVFEVATGTAIAVTVSFIYVHMYILVHIYTSLLYSACFNRRDGSRAGKGRRTGLTQVGGDTQLRGGVLHDFRPHKIPAQQPGECNIFQLEDSRPQGYNAAMVSASSLLTQETEKVLTQLN